MLNIGCTCTRASFIIVKMVYGFVCRLDSSVNNITKDILTTSLRFHPGYVNTGAASYIYDGTYYIYTMCTTACDAGWYMDHRLSSAICMCPAESGVRQLN